MSRRISVCGGASLRRSCALLLALVLLLSGCAFAPAEPHSPAKTADGESLTVWFLDVGQADSALLCCGGEYMLIDGGNVDDASCVVSCLLERGVQKLSRVVCTHCDEDHCGGLAGVLAKFPTDEVFCSVTEYTTKAFSNFVKYTEAQGLSVTVPDAGSEWTLGGAQISVLGPLRDYENNNDNSLVLRVEYGDTSFLFTGDMGLTPEDELVESGAELSADVLKVGHHGSAGSTGYVFLREVMPAYAVISVGAGNSYGHPSDDALSRLRDAEAVVCRTDLQGTITAVSDGKTVTLTSEREAPADKLNPTADAEDVRYIGNIQSKVFHRDTCGNLPSEKNQVEFDSAWDAIEAGYRAHSCVEP